MTKNQWMVVLALALGVVLEFCLLGIVAVNRFSTLTAQNVAAVVETATREPTRVKATATRRIENTRTPEPTATWVIQPKTPAPPPYDENADAKKQLAAALAQAKVDHKRVLLDFGANWCPACNELALFLADDSVRPLVEANYHVVSIDVGKGDKNSDLNVAYGYPTAPGIPAMVILNPDGKMVASTKNEGWGTDRIVSGQEIVDFLERWAPK